MKILGSISIVLLLLLALSDQALACSCASFSVRQKLRGADAVFVGRVVEVTPTNPTRDHPMAANFVKFAVEKRWKGPRRPELTILSNFDMPGFCGDLKLIVGDKYLIYSEREKGQLTMGADCGPNARVEFAAAEIKQLNSFWFRFFSRAFPYPNF